MPAYGYLRDNNLKLYPDPEKGWVISKVFELMANGMGRQTIAQELDRLDITPPQGEYWNPSTISSIIKNEVYLGHIIWGKIRYTKQNGKYIRKKYRKKDGNDTIMRILRLYQKSCFKKLIWHIVNAGDLQQ